jgi:hypothetical protein
MKTLQFAIVAAAMSLSAQASAQYVFSCYPPTEHAIGPTAPNVLMMLDMSGSMGASSGEDIFGDSGNESKYEVAEFAIGDVANSIYDPGACPGNCDDVRLGLAYFPGGSSDPFAYSAETVGEDSAPDVITWLANNSPNGRTPTGEAARYIRDTNELRDSSRPNIAILISDGEPSDNGSTAASNQARNTVDFLCDANRRTNNPQVTTYVVGFGAGSNENINSAFAAAGGTGHCCQGTSAPCDPADQVDICNVDLSTLFSSTTTNNCGSNDCVAAVGGGLSCTGSIEADGSDIKDELLSIVTGSSCIFELDIPPGYPNPEADADPDATEVKIFHSVFGAEIPIPPVGSGDTLPDEFESRGMSETAADEYEDEGWEFTGASRRFVKLSDRLCADIQTSQITKVTTEIACACTLVGQPCTYDYENGAYTPSQLDRMRCSQGVYICVGSNDVCDPTSGKMPEICNGLDDDCDGTSDNMSDSWDKAEFMGMSLPPEHAGLDCAQRDVCVCPGGARDDHEGTDFATYLDGWDPACSCGEGLGY